MFMTGVAVNSRKAMNYSAKIFSYGARANETPNSFLPREMAGRMKKGASHHTNWPPAFTGTRFTRPARIACRRPSEA